MAKRLFSLCMLMLLLPLQAVWAEGCIDFSYTVSFRQTDARSMLSMINAFRTGDSAWYWNPDNKMKTWMTDLQPLAYDYDLERVAMQRAAECALRYSHTRPNGESCFTAYDEMIGGEVGWMGENIAAGYNAYEKASEVFAGWREDKDAYSGQGHRRNMLGDHFNCIGIGHVVYNGYHFWAQALGYRNTPNTTETAASNKSASVTASVDETLITSISITGLSQRSLEVLYEERTPLPSIGAKIKVSGRWPSDRAADKVNVFPDWTSSDPECVSIEGGYALGHALGHADLSAAFAGKVFSLAATVQHSALLASDLVLPASLRAVGEETFYAVPARAAVIPSGVHAIGDRAFAACQNLYQISIPSSVASISESAFEDCPELIYFCCPEGSAAAAYAKAHGYTVIRSR